MRILSVAELKDINAVPVLELDKQIMSGERQSVFINDGRIIGEEE